MDRARVLEAVKVLSSEANLDDAQLVEELKKGGFSAREAGLLVALVPTAFGRPLLEKLGVTEFAPSVSVPKRAGGWVDLPLAQFPIFTTALSVAKEHWRSGTFERRAYESIALRSAEVNAANRALNDGVDIKGATVASALVGPPFAEDLGYGSFLSRLRQRFVR